MGISELFVPKGGKVSGNGATLITRRKIKHPPIHLGCVCVILPAPDDRYDYVADERTDALGHLVNSSEALAADEKFTKYSLDLDSDKDNASTKAKKFAEVLGIYEKDWKYLKNQIVDGVKKYRPVRKNSTEYGEKYTIMIPVRGLNGKKAIVETAWQYDTGSDYPRLVTLFVAKSKKEQVFRLLLDDLEN